MNNIFKINSVYSNDSFRQLRGIKLAQHLNFYVTLYEDHPQDSPFPKAQREHQRHIDEWKDNMTNYIIPVKHTKCFLTYLTVYGFTDRKKVRVDENGNEYVIIDDIIISANDITGETPDEAKSKKGNEDMRRGHDMRYIDKLMHLEEYGYTYLSNLERVESIEELNKAFGK